MKAIVRLLALALCLQIQTPSLFAETIPKGTVTAQRTPTITVKDLGTFEGNVTVPVAINNRGEVAITAWIEPRRRVARQSRQHCEAAYRIREKSTTSSNVITRGFPNESDDLTK
jgi:hypothetical protein